MELLIAFVVKPVVGAIVGGSMFLLKEGISALMRRFRQRSQSRSTKD